MLDGRPLPSRAPDDQRGRGYLYDAEAGVLHLRYSHRAPRRLEVTY